MKINSKKYPLPGRIRHHTMPYLYLPASELKFIPDYYPTCYEKLNWEEIFINKKQPDALDIGCGKGSFLLDYAESNPKKNILGLELRITLVNWLNDIIKGEKIENCAALWYSVANGLPFIENNSIESVFYLFPDPWSKRKHFKRRAFNQEFLKEIERILKKDGSLYLATDVFEVDEYHRETLNKNGKFTFQYILNDEDWSLPITNKEKFCKAKNILYTRMLCKKN